MKDSYPDAKNPAELFVCISSAGFLRSYRTKYPEGLVTFQNNGNRIIAIKMLSKPPMIPEKVSVYAASRVRLNYSYSTVAGGFGV